MFYKEKNYGSQHDGTIGGVTNYTNVFLLSTTIIGNVVTEQSNYVEKLTYPCLYVSEFVLILQHNGVKFLHAVMASTFNAHLSGFLPLH